jgi:hypothetical protein
LSLEPGTLLTGFFELGGTVYRVLDACPDEGEAALKGGFHLTDGRVDRVVDGLEKLSDLADAE